MNNSNGFQTNVWGAPMWLCLHIISLNYTPRKKQGYSAFFNSLQHVLPCGSCRDNYHRIITDILPMKDAIFKSREAFAMWVFLLHNQVQRDIYTKTKLSHDKPRYNDSVLDFSKAMQFYEHYRAKCVKNSHGCVVPLKGSRMRTRIHIARFSKPRLRNAITTEL